MTRLDQQEKQQPLLGLNEHKHNKAIQPLQLLQEEYLSSQTLQFFSKPVTMKGII
jgi:hypothetical protein